MYVWLSLLKKNYSERLRRIKISRAEYVRRQVYSWYIQYKSGSVAFLDLLRWGAQLSFMDWLYLFLIFFDKQSWQRLWQMFCSSKKNKVQNLWLGAMPLENINNIKEFSAWINSRAVFKDRDLQLSKK